MEEQREESEFVGDFSEPMEEAGKGLGLSSKSETLDGEDTNTVEVSDSDVCGVSAIDVNPNDGGSATVDGNTDNLVSDEKQVKADVANVEDTGEETKDNFDDVALTESITEPEIEKNDMECDGDAVPVEVGMNSETAMSEVKCKHGQSHESAGQGDSVISDGNEVTDDKAKCEVEDKSDACEVEQNANTEKSQQSSVDAEMLSVADKKADQEKESTNDEGKITIVKAGGALDSACNQSVGASVVQTQDIPIAEADVNSSNVVNEMEIDERKDNAVMASNLTEKIIPADLANPNSPSEDAAPGEVESLDHNALFDPTSDITNFIDFSGVSSWSGNTQDLKTDTRNVALKEDKKAADMAEEVGAVGIESSEAGIASGAQSPAAATDCSKEASDAILGSEKLQEDKDHECLDKKTADQQDTMREEEETTHEAPSIDPNQEEDTEMEENPNNSDYADDEAGSDIKTNGVKRKVDVLSEESPGEGRKTVSLAKVSFAQKPSFKIGACIARAASQMAGSSSVLKGSNFDDETLPVESFVSQLHCAATDPDKENVVSDIAAGFFLDFRNSSALQQGIPEKVSNKRGRPSNSNVAGTETFEFEEMGDTYWTDRVIRNGGEEQTQPTETGNYQVVPVDLKPAQLQRTRRPYRRRQAQINIPLSVSSKPANFDENAPAELVMKFSEADTIPPEKSLSKMFRHFGPIKESQTEVDKENNRARVVYMKGADAEIAYNSAGRFSIFGAKAVNYEISYTITETFKVRPYVVSLGEEDAALCFPS